MKTIPYLTALLVFIGCTKPTEPDNSIKAGDYYPLRIGNKWYYTVYRYPTGYDTSRVYEIEEVVGTKVILGQTYYAIQTSRWDWKDSINQTFVVDDTLYCRLDGSKIIAAEDSSRQRVIQSYVFADFALKEGEKLIYSIYVRTYTRAGTYDSLYAIDMTSEVKSRDGNRITLFYDRPGWSDVQMDIIYEKGKGIVEQLYQYGQNRKLLRCKIN